MKCNSYFLDYNTNGDLEVVYVTPCGVEKLIAHIPRWELRQENPILIFDVPNLGVNGIIKIGKLLEERSR